MNHFRKYFPNILSETGISLLAVIIAMVVVATLGAGLLALFSTASFNQVEAQKTSRAYYLSESGIRIVAGEYAHSTDKNQTLVNLQEKTFTLSNNDGSFDLQILPYWFYVKTGQAAGQTIQVFLPGKLPTVSDDSSTSIIIPAPGILKLKNYTRVGIFNNAPTIASFQANQGGTLITFTINTNTPCSSSCTGFPYSIPAGSELYLGYIYASPQQVSQRGDLVITDKINTAGLYPPTNGSINIRRPKGGFYELTYESRLPKTIDYNALPSSFTLHNIQPAAGAEPPIFPIVITYDGTSEATKYDPSKTTQIYLGKTLGIQSISTYGN